MINKLKNRVIEGGEITHDDALWLVSQPQKELLYDSAREITSHFFSRRFDMCSIINAKSGQCSEDCKWCAQSAHFKTKVDTYELLSVEECVQSAMHNHKHGVSKFALVTSGRKLSKGDLDKVSDIYKKIAQSCDIKLCASMGLLDVEELKQLKNSGVQRYHCNLESAPSIFPSLCTTHTQQQKIETIKAAQSIGMSICSGGIIGMGESMEQRIELAFVLKGLGVDSIPINILQPIKGTPLEGSTPLSDEDILTTVAIFRFINPTAWLRFAGGRAQMSRPTLESALKIGVNSSIVGDMLTTIGSQIKEDKELITKMGYEL